MARPQALSARGNQPGGLRRAPARPARLRAARPALSPAATSRRCELFEDRFFVAFPPGAAERAARQGRRRRRSTRPSCCCSRTAIASRTMLFPPATGPSCAPRRRCSAPRCTPWSRWSTTGSASPCVPEMAVGGGHTRRHRRRRPPPRRRPSLAPHRPGLAQGLPARKGVPPAGRGAQGRGVSASIRHFPKLNAYAA